MTRVRRINLGIGVAMLALVTGLSSARSQTFDEAVRLNTHLATSLCIKVMTEGTPARAAFEASGFVYRAVDRGVNEYGVALGLDHYFDAPAGTAKAEVLNPDGTAGLCQVYTGHLTEAEVSQIVANEVFRTHPGALVRGPTELSLPTASGLPLIVTTTTIERHRYEAPGTVSVSMSFPG